MRDGKMRETRPKKKPLPISEERQTFGVMYPSFAPCDLAKCCSFTKAGGNNTTILQESKSKSLQKTYPLFFQLIQTNLHRANGGKDEIGFKLQQGHHHERAPM